MGYDIWVMDVEQFFDVEFPKDMLSVDPWAHAEVMKRVSGQPFLGRMRAYYGCEGNAEFDVGELEPLRREIVRTMESGGWSERAMDFLTSLRDLVDVAITKGVRIEVRPD